MLRLATAREITTGRRRVAVDNETLNRARTIVDDVGARGEVALREHAERFGDLDAGAPLVVPRDALEDALRALPAAQRALLERTAERIRTFARAQAGSFHDLDVAVPGGRAGHEVVPVESAGCYAPGGRFPLPSSVLMTAVTARAAGVATVWVASPRPAPVTLAAAAVAGADALLAAGGAQAIAALAYGAGPVPPCDVVVGPGNRWVTAAKQLVAGRVGIDMLAGPSELVVIADASADAATVAADLLAQAEHDPDALPVLITLDEGLAHRVNGALAVQLERLPTRATAESALRNGSVVVAADIEDAAAVANCLAPEHLQLAVRDSGPWLAVLKHYGALFTGSAGAEVLGDYGAGPNHVLPTGGTARFTGGLSVLHFVRVRTWLALEEGPATVQLARDAAELAALEGLAAHAHAAALRAR